MWLLMAPPVLVQSNNRILFTRLRPVGGHGDKHLCSPLLCRERTLLTPEDTRAYIARPL